MFNKKSSPGVSAVIVAAGSSSRMGGINKQLLLLDGIPVLARTLMQFSICSDIGEIIVVTSHDLILTVSDMVREFCIDKVAEIVPGGKTRQESVFEGLKYVHKELYPITAIHDGARPFVSASLLRRTVDAARLWRAAAPGVPAKDTVKEISPEGFIFSTPDRSTLRLIQTPQVFDSELICHAYKSALENSITGTDDCSLAEYIGANIKIVDGEYTNIKITTPEDIPSAEAILRSLSAE